jgi:heme oxygenase
MRLLAQLKADTAEAHAALERSMNVFEKVRTADDYRELLLRFLAIFEPLENRLGDFDWAGLGFDFNARRKTPLLRDDLLFLSGSNSDASMPSPAQSLPALKSASEAAGCLYVLEGSTLGGQILSKHFHEHLGVTPEAGGRFFHGYGSATGTRWREFGAWLDRMSSGVDFDAAAAHGARETFRSFAATLNR